MREIARDLGGRLVVCYITYSSLSCHKIFYILNMKGYNSLKRFLP